MPDLPENVPGMPSDADMFRQSTAPEPAPTPTPAPQPQPQATPSPAPQPPPLQGYSDDPQPVPQSPPGKIPVRDDQGRFTGQYREPQPGDDEQPPSYRFKEMREERDRVARENRQWELAYHEAMQRQRALEAQMQDAQKQQQPSAIPDPVVDPQGWNNYINNALADSNRRMEQNFSFRLAHDRHGEAFQHAYSEMIARAQRGDPSIVRSVMQSPDPGSAMMQWYSSERNNALLQGQDPITWAREVWLRESMKDPRFVGWVLEQARGTAQQPSPDQGYYQGGQQPVVQLPPSLSSIPTAAPVTATNGDMSDASLFDFAMRQGRPRR